VEWEAHEVGSVRGTKAPSWHVARISLSALSGANHRFGCLGMRNAESVDFGGLREFRAPPL
jgi:hypothetical protein